jgi:hypothetical protein
MSRQLYTCPTCGETLSSPPRFYICPAMSARRMPEIQEDPQQPAPVPRGNRGGRKPRITDADIARVRDGDLKALTINEAAKALGCTPSYVSMIRNGLARTNAA